MNHAETLDAILLVDTMPDAVIRLDSSMFIGANSNPLATLALWCSGEGGAGLEELAALTGLDPETFLADRPMPADLDKDTIHLALGKLVRVWLAVARNDLAEVAGLTGREPLPGIVPEALARALQRTAPVRVASAREAA